jgi:PAS domain S-box-containing protein
MSVFTSSFPTSHNSAVAQLIQSHDWRQSPIGAPASWPVSLRTVVSLMLDSKFPMFVAWGPELTFLYNDAYSEILGEKHPAALGSRFEDIWSEIWEDISPIIERAMGGVASFYENLPLTMQRKGYAEQTWFTFSYSPVYDENGKVGGMYCACTETTQQVLAERHRQQENARLHQLFQQAPGMMAVLRGPDHVFELVNDAYLQLVGSRELIGKAVREALPEVEGQGFFELLDQVYASGEHVVGRETPVLLQRQSGGPLEQRFVNFVYQPIRDAAGRVTGIFMEGSDVTDAVRADQALRDSEARLNLALTAGRMGGWQWDIKQDSRHWLKGMSSVHGLPEGTPTPDMTSYMDMVHPEDREALRAELADVLANRRDYRIEYRILWPDGQTRWIEAYGHLLLDEAGNPSQLGGLCIDVTDRKKIEQNLQFLAQASAELASFVDLQTTLNKVAQLAVPHFADWCAVDMVEGDSLNRVAVAHIDPFKIELARDLRRRFPPDQNSGTWKVIRSGQAVLVPEMTREMIEASIADPEYRAALLALGLKSYIGAPLTSHGKTIGVLTFIWAESRRTYTPADLALAEDLARRAAIAVENMRLYEALKQSDRGKDVFLATLSHELRNPLASVTTGLSLLRLSGFEKQVAERTAGVMERQVKQLVRLVDDLMDVSRVVTGKIALKSVPTTLSEVLDNAIDASRPAIDAARHRLTLILPDEPTDIVADPVRLAQVFSNLLHNAAKYTDPGGSIEVKVESAPQQWLVRVSDTGIGIAPDMLTHVFDMFTQEHPLAREQGGLGVGLGLAENLIRLHGGSIEAHSAGRGKGSEFVVRLPHAPMVRLHASQPAPGPVSDTKRAVQDILVVDDNADAASTTAELLSLLGHRVRTAHDGSSALQAVRESVPDVVFLDIGLPDMDGYDVARRLRAMPEIAQPLLVAVTGWGQDKDKQAAMEAGFNHHLTKPVDMQQLLKMLPKV